MSTAIGSERVLLLFIFAYYGISFCLSAKCPAGGTLECGGPDGRCCVRDSGDHYCCSEDFGGNGNVIVGLPHWQNNYWGVVIGVLIASIIASIILSLICCLCCNGCWLHRYRNPHLYVQDRSGMPLGTVIYSPYMPPPQRPYDPALYSADGSDTSHYSRNNKVRFEDPKRP